MSADKNKNHAFIYYIQKPEVLEISNTNLLETQFGSFWMKLTTLCLHIFFTASSYQREKTFLVHKTHQVKGKMYILRHNSEKQNDN